MTPPPAADFQVRFLKDLQRILEEGIFTASYKFALVHALADLSVQRGDDSGDPLRLPLDAIAERFVELYWRQVAPWPGAHREGVLTQNTGRRAAVVSRVLEARASYGHRLHRARADDAGWESLTASVASVVRVMPLWKLQTVGREAYPFLYENRLEGRGAEASIRLKPGIAYCFRTFHPLVLDLVRGAWVRFIRKLNPELLDEPAELRDFLFGAQRSVLEGLRSPLAELQAGSCFYCERPIRDGHHVDHFIPWSRYPVDLGHNFVLAHERCNLAKSDHLSAARHLEKWAARNHETAYDLGQIFGRAGVAHDLATSNQVTRWAYRQVEERRGLVWDRGHRLIPLGTGWSGLLENGAP